MKNGETALANMRPGTKYVTVSDAAKHLRVSRNTIYDACRDNEVEHIQVRSSLRVLIDVNEEYLTVAETANLLNVSPSTVYEACSVSCDYGQLPHIRIRSRIRIPSSRLQNYERKEPVPSGLSEQNSQSQPAFRFG